MAKSNHIHRYKKINLRNDGSKPYWVYKCIKPMCPHYVPVKLSLGQMCECSRCNNVMMITKIQLRGSSNGPMTYPHCVDCIESKRVSKTDKTILEQFLAQKETEKERNDNE